MAACYILFQHQYRLLAGYILALLVIPIALWSVYLGRQAISQHYHDSSRWLKIIMILGVFSLVIYYLQLFLNNGAS